MTERATAGAVEITSLHTYPIKGCRGTSFTARTLLAAGFEWDRNWMFVTDAGRFITQRENAGLARVDVRVENGELILGSAGFPTIRCPVEDDGPRRQVVIWRDTLNAQQSTVDTRAWLQAVTGSPGQLVRVIPRQERTCDPRFTGASHGKVRFADAYSLLVVNEASLEDLNRRLPRPLPMARFRPNIVVRGIDAYAEDDIEWLRLRDLEIKCVKPCTRCIVTTTDQVTGARDGDQPLRTLRTYRRIKSLQGEAFGMNAIVTGGAGSTLSVGDRLEISWRAPTAARAW